MKDRRGYEKKDLMKAAKSVEKKGGKKGYEAAMGREKKDYIKDVMAYHHETSSKCKYPSGKMGVKRSK